MSLDDVMDKAMSPAHRRKATELHNAVLEGRVGMLMHYFPNTLGEEAKEQWDGADVMGRIRMMQEAHYKLPKEDAYKLIRKIGVYVLREHNEAFASELEKALDVRYDEESDMEAKADAERTIGMAKGLLRQLGFDMQRLETEAAEQGFTSDIWEEATRAIPQSYMALTTNSYMNLVEEDEWYQRLDEIAEETGLKKDIVKGKGIDEVRSLITSHKQYKDADDLDGFKKDYHHYFG